MIVSKYTTEIRFLCESWTENKPGEYPSVETNIAAGVEHIFDFEFPIFDESYRSVLCSKILRHYYTREIGEETYGLWKLRLQTKMLEIMPYYNKLYNSGLDEFNPLWDTQMTTTYKRTQNDDGTDTEGVTTTGTDSRTGQTTNLDVTKTTFSSTGEQTSNVEDTGHTRTKGEDDSTDWDKYSDTPQGTLTNVVASTYLTNFRIVEGQKLTDHTTEDTKTSNGTTKDTNNGEQKVEDEGLVKTSDSGSKNEKIDRNTKRLNTTTEDYVLTVNGRQGTDVAKALAALRESLLNIDMMVINELEQLFMTIW